MKDTLKIKLPAIKTVLSWSNIKFIKPFIINDEVIKTIMKKVKTFSERDKEAIFTFNEISIN